MPTTSSASHANAAKGDRTAAKTPRQEGIITLYASFADDHVQLHEKKGKVKKISREKVERQLLSAIDEAEIPIEYKMSWYHAMLVSPNFEAFWKAVSKRHKLPKSCTERFKPDPDLYEYDAPTDDEAEETENGVDHEAEDDIQDETHSAIHNDATPAKINPPSSVSQGPARVTDHGSPPSSSSDSDYSSRSGTPENWVPLTEENKLARPVTRTLPPMCNECGSRSRPCFCSTNNDEDGNDSDYASERSSQCGGHEIKVIANCLPQGTSASPEPVCHPLDELRGHHEPPSTASGNVNGLSREGDDGAYGESSSKSKGKSKAKAFSYDDSCAALDDVNGLASEEGDDSEYEETPSKSKGKGKAIATPTIKGAAKPKGVTKNKAAPKKKEQTAAQLKMAAAKTREPVKATNNAVTKASQAVTTPAHTSNGNNKEAQVLNTPSQAATIPVQAANSNNKQAQIPATPSQAAITPAHPSNSNNTQAARVLDEVDKNLARAQAKIAPNQAAGTKRVLEKFPDDDEDDSPATKKAKVGGAAATNGGRKKASPKQTTKRKSLEEEWDGIPRGFGEY